MRKITAACAAALLFLVGQVVWAQELEGRLGLGVGLGYSDIAHDDTFLGSTEADGSLFFQANITYFIVNWFSLEFSAGYSKYDLDLDQSGNFVEWGDLEQIPLLLTARFYWWNEIPLVGLYLGGGFGYYFNGFDVSDSYRTTYPGVLVDFDDTLGFHIVGGFEYFFNKDFAINVDLKYTLSKADFSVSRPGSPSLSSDVDLNAFYGCIGVRYYF